MVYLRAQDPWKALGERTKGDREKREREREGRVY
jgi:hypothetical protein